MARVIEKVETPGTEIIKSEERQPSTTLEVAKCRIHVFGESFKSNIGGVAYDFVANTEYTVPVDVACILINSGKATKL